MSELVDLGSLMELVATGGVDPSDSLEAKSAGLRAVELGDVRSELEAASEHMNFRVAIMGFVIVVLLARACQVVEFPRFDGHLAWGLMGPESMSDYECCIE